MTDKEEFKLSYILSKSMFFSFIIPIIFKLSSEESDLLSSNFHSLSFTSIFSGSFDSISKSSSELVSDVIFSSKEKS